MISFLARAWCDACVERCRDIRFLCAVFFVTFCGLRVIKVSPHPQAHVRFSLGLRFPVKVTLSLLPCLHLSGRVRIVWVLTTPCLPGSRSCRRFARAFRSPCRSIRPGCCSLPASAPTTWRKCLSISIWAKRGLPCSLLWGRGVVWGRFFFDRLKYIGGGYHHLVFLSERRQYVHACHVCN